MVWSLRVRIKGKAKGKLRVAIDLNFYKVIWEADININEYIIWHDLKESCYSVTGIYPIYFQFIGDGYIDFKEFELFI